MNTAPCAHKCLQREKLHLEAPDRYDHEYVPPVSPLREAPLPHCTSCDHPVAGHDDRGCVHCECTRIRPPYTRELLPPQEIPT